MESEEMIVCNVCCESFPEDEILDKYNNICRNCIEDELSGGSVFDDDVDLEGNLLDPQDDIIGVIW